MTFPLLGIINRWLRWAFISVIAATLIAYLEWINRSFEVLFFISFLSWFLIETAYNWFSIKFLSKSDFPLFPKFRKIFYDNSHEWPIQKNLLQVKSWIDSNNFEEKDSLVADYVSGVQLRCLIYDSEDKITRLQVLLAPRSNGRVVAFFSFISILESGTRLITDNVAIPFGGFYPDDWKLKRRPLTVSVKKLYDLHSTRLNKATCKPIAIELNPQDDLNNQQVILEDINEELGFLNPLKSHEYHGRISGEGCYRIWKEIWLLKYLGVSMY